MDRYPRTWAEVDLRAFASNLSRLRSLAPEATKMCLVAKADAYGHGLIPMCRQALKGDFEWLAVAAVSEGIALRDSGISAPILVLSPVLPIEADQAVFYDLDVTVESVEMATPLRDSAIKMAKRARIHLKVDTGLARFGCHPELAPSISAKLSEDPFIHLVGISTHFIDSRHRPDFTQRQRELFHQTVKNCSVDFEFFHSGNSAGFTAAPSDGNLIRIGLLAYGIDGAELMTPPMEPVLSLKSRIVAARWIEAGATVGYAATHVAAKKTRVLTIGAGYGDGIPRRLSNRGFVEVHGALCPIIGLVCMDQLMIDGTSVPDANLGDVVHLIGGKATAAKLAEWAETNAHEIVTRITPRAPRRFIYP